MDQRNPPGKYDNGSKESYPVYAGGQFFEYPTPPDSGATVHSKQQLPNDLQPRTPERGQRNPFPTFNKTPGRPASTVLSDRERANSQLSYAVGSTLTPLACLAPLNNQWQPQSVDQLNFIPSDDRSSPCVASSTNWPPRSFPGPPITATPTAMPAPVYHPRTLIYDRRLQEPPASTSRPIVKRQVDQGSPRAITGSRTNTTGRDAVTLSVTNLDYNITSREWFSILHREFQQFIKVLDINIQTQPDGSLMALVNVNNEDDARFVISKCHRKKIGYKRVQVSLYRSDLPKDPQRLRAEVFSILDEVSSKSMPLFKFVENYEKRFYRTVSVAELYNMKDTVEIKDSVASTGRTVCLQASLCLQKSVTGRGNRGEELQFPESPYCTTHCCQAAFTLIEETGMLPYVKIDLETFASQVGVLLTLHSNDMHLMSFTFCYEAIYSKMVETSDGGVPLEHLISCVTGVYIRVDSLGIKKVALQESRPHSPTGSIYSETSTSETSHSRSGHALNQQLSQFAREVVDLLKRMPGCQMAFSKFIPSYHHHFGRQCRVADFGFTKLQELFEAIPHVLQILGTGTQRILYLTHRIHQRRFTADLCRVLKAQPEKTCTINEFPERYSEVIGTDLNISSFGVCYIEDILMGITETTVQVEREGDSTRLSIPKKDQTPEEIKKTKQFSYEVINLLKNCSQCTMVFNKFIPAYHHHFGRQCRVADYGFAKLLELFEAIPEVVIVRENGEERYISLTNTELHKVLSEHILTILKTSGSNSLEIKQLGPAYQKAYGHSLHIEDFGSTSVEELIETIPNIAHIQKQAGENVIVLNNKCAVEQLATRCLEILMAHNVSSVKTSEFIEKYKESYNDSVNLVEVRHSLSPAIIITQDKTSGMISLHSLLAVAQRVLRLLHNHQGKLNLMNFEMTYKQSFGVKLGNDQNGLPGVTVLLQIMDFLVSVRGRGIRQTILLRQDYASRLAHQLAYKVGIYTELVKYKSTTCETVGDGSNERAASVESIIAGSPDMFNGNQMTAVGQCPLFSMEDFPPIGAFKPTLEQTRRTLGSMALSNQQQQQQSSLQPGKPGNVPSYIPYRLQAAQRQVYDETYVPSNVYKDK